MATVRNGTYIAFHANKTTEPTESDIKYYNLLKAWDASDEFALEFVNSHDKTSAVRDSSSKETLRRSLITRLKRSRNFVLIIGDTTKEDTDWIPFEIEYAITDCAIPIIATYPGFEYILSPSSHSALWPSALKKRINDNTAKVIHIPFKEKPLTAAIRTFDHNNMPGGSDRIYTKETYQKWGIIEPS